MACSVQELYDFVLNYLANSFWRPLMNRIIWTAGLLMTLTSCGSLSPSSQVLTLRTDSVKINQEFPDFREYRAGQERY